MNTARPILPSENQTKTKEPRIAVDHANTMCAKERGRNTNIAARAHVSLPISHSLRSIIPGICSMMFDESCDI